LTADTYLLPVFHSLILKAFGDQQSNLGRYETEAQAVQMLGSSKAIRGRECSQLPEVHALWEQK
jgi:hypothetical protein